MRVVNVPLCLVAAPILGSDAFLRMQLPGGPMQRRTLLETAAAATLPIASAALLPQEASAASGKRIKNPPVVQLPNGATFQEMTVGNGAKPEFGDRVAVHYSLFCNGLEVESTRESSGLAARPFGFTFGTPSGPGSIGFRLGMPSKNIEAAMEGMQVGSRRKIVLPANLAYGAGGRPPFVPGGASVLIDVSMWSVKPKGTNENFTLPSNQAIPN